MIIQVLDHGYVQLVDHWGTEEKIIEAARMSTGKGFKDWKEDFKLLKYLYKHKHLTPFEMCGMTIEVKAPIFVFREWHRHRTMSYNEMSARYIPLPNEHYLPTLTDLMQRSKEAAETKNRQASGTGVVITENVARGWLQDLERAYMHAELAYDAGLRVGVPKELARLTVNVGRYSKMRASANLRNWLQFLALRMPYTAQKEIRLYAEGAARLLTEWFPKTMSLFMEDLVVNEPRKENGHYVGLDRTKG